MPSAPMTRGFITVERVALMETTGLRIANFFSFSSIGISIIKEIVLIVFVKINCTSFEQYNPLYGSSLHTRMKILFPFVRNFHRISELKCKPLSTCLKMSKDCSCYSKELYFRKVNSKELSLSIDA